MQRRLISASLAKQYSMPREKTSPLNISNKGRASRPASLANKESKGTSTKREWLPYAKISKKPFDISSSDDIVDAEYTSNIKKELRKLEDSKFSEVLTDADLLNRPLLFESLWRYANQGNTEAIENVFERLLKDNNLLTGYHYSHYLRALVRAGQIEKAEALVKDIIRPQFGMNEFIYKSLLYGNLVCTQNISRARKLYDEMIRYNIPITPIIGEELFTLFEKEGNPLLAIKHMRDYLDCSYDNSIPITVFSKFLRICKKRTDYFEEMMYVFEQMKAKGYSPSVACYNSMFQACLNNRHFDTAIRLWNEMRDNKTEPTFVTYASMLQVLALYNVGDPLSPFPGCQQPPYPHWSPEKIQNFAEQLFDECKVWLAIAQQSKKGEAYSPLTGFEHFFVTYLTIFLNINNETKALHVYDVLYPQYRVVPSEHTYLRLIQYFGKVGKVESAQLFFEKMQQLPKSVRLRDGYLRLIEGYAKIYDLERAMDLLNEMHEKKMKPIISELNTLIFRFRELGDDVNLEKLESICVSIK